MRNDKLIIGSHVSLNSPLFYLGSVQEALSYGATTFMFYTGAPQNSYRLPLERLRIEEGRKLLLENHIDESKLVVHAPYIVNPANKTKEDLFEMSIRVINDELNRTAAFNAKILVLHPGAHVNQGRDIGIKNIAEALDKVFAQNHTDVKIALETMSGKGSELGITFEEIRQIIDLCQYKDRLGVCLDTCHINDAGYNVHDVEGILDEFDRVIGLDRLLVIHVNDSKNPIGAHKDRHENIGYGEIGFDTLNKYVNNPRLVNIPKILETPYYLDKPPYKKEIAMFKDDEFVNAWRDELE